MEGGGEAASTNAKGRTLGKAGSKSNGKSAAKRPAPAPHTAFAIMPRMHFATLVERWTEIYS